MPPKSSNSTPPVGPIAGIAPGILGTLSQPSSGRLPAQVIETLKKDPKVWAAVQQELEQLQKTGGLSDAAAEKLMEAMQERIKNQQAPPCTWMLFSKWWLIVDRLAIRKFG